MRTGQRPWVFSTATLLTTGLLIALLGIGIAGCGYSSVGVASISSTSTSAQVLQPQTLVHQCGTVHGYGALKLVPQDQGSLQAENCFWQAFQHCQPATLVFTTSGVIKALFASTVVRTFSLHKVNGVCLISDSKQTGISLKSLSPTTTYICSGLKRFPRALYILGCGKDGTIVVIGF